MPQPEPPGSPPALQAKPPASAPPQPEPPGSPRAGGSAWGLSPEICDSVRKLLDNAVAARVVCIDRGRVSVVTEHGEARFVSVKQHLKGDVKDVELGLGVGDWVALDAAQAWALGIVPRKSQLVRRSPGRAERPQLVGANLDRVFVVTAAGHDFSVQRLERFVSLVHDGGAEPVVVINKIDTLSDRTDLERELARLGSARVLWLSGLTGAGMPQLSSLAEPGSTIAFVGSSGVGKSTLVNNVLGHQHQLTQAVRADDDKGRHTTTRRELFLAENGVLVMDTPGVRELGLWLTGEGLAQSFDDVAALARACRFSNCGHGQEPGCALRAAVKAGQVSAQRLRSFLSLSLEAQGVNDRRNLGRARAAVPRGEGKTKARAEPKGGRGRRAGSPRPPAGRARGKPRPQD